MNKNITDYEVKKTTYQISKKEFKELFDYIESESSPHCLKVVYRASEELKFNLINWLATDWKVKKNNDITTIIKKIRQIGMIMLFNFNQQIKHHEPVFLGSNDQEVYCNCLTN